MSFRKPTTQRRNCSVLASTLLIGVGLLIGMPKTSWGQIEIASVQRNEPVSFAKDILPIFQKNCLACHNETDRQGDLTLESPESILKGGDSGPAAVAGKGGESLILQIASHAEEPVMPPEDNDVAAENLTPEQLGLLKLWIDQGAKAEPGSLTLSPKQWSPLPAGIHPVYALAISEDGQFLACSRSNQIHLYHIPTGQLITRLSDESLGEKGQAHRDLVQSLSFNSEGDLLASGGFREVKIWRRPRDVQQREWKTGQPVGVADLHRESGLIATVTPDHKIRIWDLSTGQVVRELTGHTAKIHAVDFGPLGKCIASSSEDGTIRLWDLSDGKQVGILSPQVQALSLTWSLRAAPTPPNDEAAKALTWQQQLASEYWLVSGDQDNKLRVWTPPSVVIESPPVEEPAEGAEPKPAEPIDPVTLYLVREIQGHSQPLSHLLAFPNEKSQVLSASRDGTARRWNLENGQQITQYNHGGALTQVAVANDGSRLATASENNTARIWNSNGQQIAELKGDLRILQNRDRLQQEERAANTRVNLAKQQLTAAEADLPKKQEAAKKADELLASTNKTVDDQKKATDKAFIEKNEAEAKAIAASLAAKQAQEAKQTAEFTYEQSTKSLALARTKVQQLQAAANLAPQNEQLQKLLAAAQQDVTQLDAKSKELMSQIAAPTQAAQQKSTEANTAAQMAAEKQTPYNNAVDALKTAEAAQNLASQQQVLAAIELKRAQELPDQLKQRIANFEKQLESVKSELEAANQAVRDAEKPMRSIAFTPDGRTVLTAGDLGRIHAWDAEDGTALRAYVGHQGPVMLTHALDDQRLISAGQDGSVRIWEATPEWTLEKTVGNVEQPEILSHRITSLDFSRDSSQLLVATGVPSRSGDLVVLDVATGAAKARIDDAHADAIYSAKFSPDGKRIATAGADKYVRLFDATNGELQRRLEGHTNYVLSVSWQGDGTRLASAGTDETIKIWDTETGDQQRTIANMTKPRSTVKFVGESTTIVSCGGDRRVRLHNSTNGGVTRNFNEWPTWLHCVDITPDGQIIAAGSADGSVGIWNGANGQLVHTLELPTE